MGECKNICVDKCVGCDSLQNGSRDHFQCSYTVLDSAFLTEYFLIVIPPSQTMLGTSQQVEKR